MFRKLVLLSNLTLVVQFFCSGLNHIPDFAVWDVCVQVFFYPLRLQIMLVSGHECSMNTAGRLIAVAPLVEFSAVTKIQNVQRVTDD